MHVLQALILGVVQGFSEFLPVSSSAHLVLTPWLFGWKDPFIDGLTFDVALHWGTLIAVLAFFWHDWVNMFVAAARWLARKDHDTQQARMFLLLVVATIPGGVAGLLFDKQAATTFRSPWLVASVMGIFALILLASELLSRRNRKMEQIGPLGAVGVGVLQALAIMPGVSRSGITMTGGLFLNLKREEAARFSFMLLAPIVGGTAILKGRELAQSGIPSGEGIPLILGIVAAAVVGFACTGFLMRFLRSRSVAVFVAYRVLLAVAVIGLVISGFRSS